MVYDRNQKKHEQGDAPFNMAMLFYVRLTKLLEEKDKALIYSDMSAYYACLVAIYNNVYFKIHDDKECEAIEKGLERARNIMSQAPPPDVALTGQVEVMNFRSVRDALLVVDKKLMVLMDKKKMIFPRIDDKISVDKIREQYGLEE